MSARARIFSQIIFILVCITTSAVQCQRRGFSHRRHRPQFPMPLPPIFQPPSHAWQQFSNNQDFRAEFPSFNKINQRENLPPELENDCPFVHVKKVTSDGFYGMISFKNQFAAENVSIEIEFEDFILAFVVRKL